MNLRPRAAAAMFVAACTVMAMVSVAPAMAGKGTHVPRKGSIAFCSSTYQITEGQNWDSDYARGNLTIDLCRTAKVKYRNATANIWVSTSAGTATSGSDYYPFEGIASFAAGSTTATITVYIRAGVPDESDETFTLSLDNSLDPGWTAGPDATVTIKQMPAPPAPTNLQANVVGSTQIDWTWDAVSFDYGPVFYSLAYNWQAPGTEGREYTWVGGVIPTSSWESTSYTQIENYCEEPPDSWGPYWFAVRASNLEGAWGPMSTPDVYVGLQCS